MKTAQLQHLGNPDGYDWNGSLFSFYRDFIRFSIHAGDGKWTVCRQQSSNFLLSKVCFKSETSTKEVKNNRKDHVEELSVEHS